MALTARYTERITVSFSGSQHEALTKVADDQKVSLSEVIRDVVDRDPQVSKARKGRWASKG